MYSKNIIAIILLINCSACFTVSTINVTDDNINRASQLKHFNGRYKVISIDTSYRNLDDSLFPENYFKNGNLPDENDIIEIEAFNKSNSLKIRLYDNDSLVQTRIIEGKFQYGYFQLESSKKYNFKKVILNLFKTRHVRLYLSKNNNLKVYSNFGGCSLFLIFPIFCGESEHLLDYERI